MELHLPEELNQEESDLLLISFYIYGIALTWQTGRCQHGVGRSGGVESPEGVDQLDHEVTDLDHIQRDQVGRPDQWGGGFRCAWLISLKVCHLHNYRGVIQNYILIDIHKHVYYSKWYFI